MVTPDTLTAPLTFGPIYKTVIWGGRRLGAFRTDLPDGAIGESWDLADHPNGQSVVRAGVHAGTRLQDLVEHFGARLVGDGFRGGPFPLLVKIIDATEGLSVQVHPDDSGARALGLHEGGKTECWVFLADGGELFQGTRPGTDRAAFERALAGKKVETLLNRFEPRAGDVHFLPARTVHALGAGTFVYELQQRSDITFRVYDWDRVDKDGRGRPLHVSQALATIDFSQPVPTPGPLRPPWQPCGHPGKSGTETRMLATCAHFRLEEQRLPPGKWPFTLEGTCAIITLTAGTALVSVNNSELDGVTILPLETALVPAAAQTFQISANEPVRLLLATPVL
jgi:mannose-6-phosphate isomerase